MDLTNDCDLPSAPAPHAASERDIGEDVPSRENLPPIPQGFTGRASTEMEIWRRATAPVHTVHNPAGV